MSEGNILGKDGKHYKTPEEAARANSVVDTQKNIENQLIQQNNMLKQQNENNYRIAMEKAKIDQENMAIQKEQIELEKQKIQEQKNQRFFQECLEATRAENEKELRILKLFDNISLPYDCFKKFKEELFRYTLTDIEKQKIEKSIFDSDISDKEKEEYKIILPPTLNQIENDIAKFPDPNNDPLLIRSGIIEDKIKKDLKFSQYKNTKEYSHLEKFMNVANYNAFKELSVSDFNILSNKQEILNTYNEINNWKQGIKIPAIVAGVSALPIMFGAGSFVIWLVFLCALFASIAPSVNRDEKIKSIRNMIYNDFNNKEKEQTEYINSKIERISEIYKKLRIEYTNKKLQKLYDFRINHYNMSIENIFYNSGLISECNEAEFCFPNIDKSNIIKEGTVEDYFFYFNNYSSDNEMQNS